MNTHTILEYFLTRCNYMKSLFNEFEDRFGFSNNFLDSNVFSICLEDEQNRMNNIAPDTFGADKFFIESFITCEMADDFWIVANDFLNHHFPRIKEFNDIAVYNNDFSGVYTPSTALQNRILSIMYNAAKTGDTYSVELIKTLYKTYHKAEYKQLKRFKTISVPEIFALGQIYDDDCEYDVIARILGMCPLLGIELEERCSILYLILRNYMETLEAERDIEFFHFKEGLYQKCYKQVEEWMENERTGVHEDNRNAAYWEADQFAGLCFERNGYLPEFMWLCHCDPSGLKHLYTLTLALLKSNRPHKEYSFEQVQTFSILTQCIESFVKVCDDYDENLSELFGTETDHDDRMFPCLYKPITVKETTPVKVAPKLTAIAPVPTSEVQEEDYLKEINELRKRLREKDQAYKQIYHQYEQTKNSLKEAEEIIQKHESERDELIALRNHVYNMSQFIPDIPEEKLDEMKAAISEKNIVIIGGHINWVNKLKKEFPKWKLLDANITRDSDSQLINGAEKVYFFSDHLSHRMYGKTINLVRANKIPFGYLHSINMESLIRQIYEDLR